MVEVKEALKLENMRSNSELIEFTYVILYST